MRVHEGENSSLIYDGAVLFPNVRLGRNVTIFPGAVIGRPPLSTGATTRQVEVVELLPVEIGDHCVIGANAVIYMGVKIGHHSMVGDTARIRENVEIGNYSLVAMGVTVSFNVKIGDRVKIMDNATIAGNTVIEDGAFIGPQVGIANDNMMGRTPTEGKDWIERGATIRRFAAIGQCACIQPGVEIGENAMVGTNSVVTKDVRPGILVVGMPARFVRTLTEAELKR